jgi:alpha-L-fucosidase
MLLTVRMVGLCGTDLNSFRGLNPLVSFPRIPGHEVSATVVECASCRHGRPNACQFNQTLGVQQDGGLTEFFLMPADKLYPAKLTAEHFDPMAWADLFKRAGAKYVVPVAEHHDGFAMYDSELSDWTVVKMGPHRDTTGELAKAVRAAGLRFGLSSHRVEHNFFLGVARAIPSDVNDPQYAAFYGPAHAWLANPSGTPLDNDFTYISSAWADDWLARSAELIEKCRPDYVFFDWWIGQPSIRSSLARSAAFYYNSSLKSGDHIGVITYKDFAMHPHSAVLDIERGQLGDIRPYYWQTDTSVSNKSWGYINDDTFKSGQFVVDQLVDIVSKNGNLLLNIGPRSDGTIPEPVQQVLLDVGGWLSVNGHAIYGTRPWRVYGEGPTKVAAGSFHDTDVAKYTSEDFRSTTKGDALCDRIGLASKWGSRDSVPGGDGRKPAGSICRFARRRRRPAIRAARRRLARASARSAACEICLCVAREISAR